MRLIDTHCHIDAPEFDPDRNEVVEMARKVGVERIVVPAVSEQRWPGLLEICRQHDGLHPALGLHPVFLDQHRRSGLDALEQALAKPGITAVGEIGLDYYLKDLDRTFQHELLDVQLSLAVRAGLPVILHCRKAYDDLIRLLKRHKPAGGTSHAFNGSIQQAHKLIDLGFRLGFGGMLTYERSTKLRNLALRLPLEAVVLETDAPDLTVSQHRGERNSPEYLPLVLTALADVKKKPVDEIAPQLYQNSRDVFSL